MYEEEMMKPSGSPLSTKKTSETETQIAQLEKAVMCLGEEVSKIESELNGVLRNKNERGDGTETPREQLTQLASSIREKVEKLVIFTDKLRDIRARLEI